MTEVGREIEVGTVEEKLNQRLASAERLLEQLYEHRFSSINGVAKMKNRIQSELKFLVSIKLGKLPMSAKYVDTTNLKHYENIISGINRFEGVSGFLQTFTIPNPDSGEILKHTVDLVAGNGSQWVKVISRSAKGICMDWVTGVSRNVFEQADTYIYMASLFQREFSPPEICFEFTTAVADKMARKLRRLGVTVIGKTVPLETLTKLPEEFLEELEEEERKYELTKVECNQERSPRPINLDVSAVFVLISNLTQPGGTEHKFASKLLSEQALLEKTIPAKEQLLSRIAGRELIICQTAYDSVKSIVSTVAGPEEKKRADEFLKTVKVVEDQVTEKAAKLVNSDHINERSRVIFASGDYHRAVTATANKHFVASAYHQGIPFDVIVHESRALSEQKERPMDWDPSS